MKYIKKYESKNFEKGDVVYIIQNDALDIKEIDYTQKAKIVDMRNGKYITDLYPDTEIHRINLVRASEVDNNTTSNKL